MKENDNIATVRKVDVFAEQINEEDEVRISYHRHRMQSV